MLPAQAPTEAILNLAVLWLAGNSKDFIRPLANVTERILISPGSGGHLAGGEWLLFSIAALWHFSTTCLISAR